MAVHYALANFNDGDRIVGLPVMEGASWAVMLNKPDQLSCQVDLRDPDVKALDILSVTEPKKTVLFASTDDGTVLAWGRIVPRERDIANGVMDITARGGWDYFDHRIIAPAAAYDATDIILPNGDVNTAYDTTVNDVTPGSIGRALVAQALAVPGSPTVFTLPAAVADVGRTSGTYRLVDYKRVGEALSDIANRVDGADFAFDAQRNSTGLGIEYIMRVGNPLLGRYVGTWDAGAPDTPVTDLKLVDDGEDIATDIWMQAGRTDSKTLVARARNAALLTAGYPREDYVDTSHTDVRVQATLDDYARQNAAYASKVQRDAPFSVKGNAPGMALGSYRPGDFAKLKLPTEKLDLRIMGFSGDETGETIKIDAYFGGA